LVALLEKGKSIKQSVGQHAFVNNAICVEVYFGVRRARHVRCNLTFVNAKITYKHKL